MSNIFSGNTFVKISELDETIEFNSSDEFVVVNGGATQKITGLNLTESIVAIGNLASKAYVDAVVDGAPALLDTLNELAAALNDDANFATTITTLISTKLASNDFNSYFDAALTAKTTTALTEGTNLFYTQARFDTAFAAKTTSDVTEGTNLYYTEQRVLDVVIPLVPTSIFDLDVPEVSVNLPGYLHYNGTTLSWESSTNPTYDTVTILAEPTSDSHAATKGYVDSQFNSFESFSGSYNDLTDKPALFSKLSGDLTWNVYPTEAGLPSAATKHGMFAHVHGTGHGYMAHAGNWIKLANYSDVPTYTTVTTTNLNVQNINFTGTGAVTITSGNDLNLSAAGNILLNGERTISLTELKTVVAASADFANFKARIAAL